MNPLTHYPRHPSAPDTYYINGAWAPAAITAVEKRFSQGELAAEWHKQDNHCGQRLEGYGVAHNGEPLADEEAEIERLRIIYRFCTNPAHDEEPA